MRGRAVGEAGRDTNLLRLHGQLDNVGRGVEHCCIGSEAATIRRIQGGLDGAGSDRTRVNSVKDMAGQHWH